MDEIKINVSRTSDTSKTKLLATQEELDDFTKKGGEVETLDPTKEYLSKASKELYTVTNEAEVIDAIKRNM